MAPWHGRSLQIYNLTLLLFDNSIYEASGLRPTATSVGVDLIAMAKGAGLQNASWAASLDDYRNELRKAKQRGALSMLGAKTEAGLEYFKTCASCRRSNTTKSKMFIASCGTSKGLRVDEWCQSPARSTSNVVAYRDLKQRSELRC